MEITEHCWGFRRFLQRNPLCIFAEYMPFSNITCFRYMSWVFWRAGSSFQSRTFWWEPIKMVSSLHLTQTTPRILLFLEQMVCANEENIPASSSSVFSVFRDQSLNKCLVVLSWVILISKKDGNQYCRFTQVVTGIDCQGEVTWDILLCIWKPRLGWYWVDSTCPSYPFV